MTQTATETETVVKVGDFFYTSWGYDQTNVDFYKVVGMTASGKSVKVQKWSSASVSDDGGPTTYVGAGGSPAMGGYVKTPEGWSQYDSSITAPVETKRLRVGGYCGASIFISDGRGHAYLWDGKPKYETGAGWGH